MATQRSGRVSISSGLGSDAIVGQPALPSRQWAIAMAVGAALLPWGTAYADVAPNTLPTGGQYAYGSGAITQQGDATLQITQSSDKGTINWNSFSIGAGASVNFTQPSASSITLNRVLGNNPSEILGRMTANGQVFLSNPSGVLFAPGASVDVGALFVTTFTLSDQDANAGRYSRWSNPGNSGSVVNQGSIITANGYTALAAPQVRNDGVILAHAGRVTLAAGNSVSLDMVGDGLIRVSVDEAVLNASAVNAGTIQADGGNVLLTARSANALLDTVVNNSGVIRADSLVERTGEIVLEGGRAGITSNSGSLEARGADAGTTGGTIKVLGEYVGLFEGSRTDASGDAAGGRILVGGNVHGSGAEANASQAYVAGDATVKADALTDGNGGTVIVWSDHFTNFKGSISARGGEGGGNGGFVEVSGKDFLNFAGTADRRAPHGSAGTLLLDPTDMTITAALVTNDVVCTLGDCTGATDASILTTTALELALSGGPVNVDATGGAGTAASGGTINWTDGSVNANGNSLTLTGAAITFDGVLTNLDSVHFSSTPAGTGSATSSTGGSIIGIGPLTFAMSGANAGTAGGIAFNGFASADSASVTGAVDFNHGAKSTQGMTFAAATAVSGTGDITNMGATAFNIAGATQGTAGVVSYDGFSSADTTTVTGASGFDDTAKSNQGITFANATNVTGSGAISNVASDFDDSSHTSLGSSITYSAGFTSISTANGGDITGTASFALTGPNAGTAASADTYTGFGSSSSAASVTGAVDFDHAAKSSQGMTFAAATTVSGTGDITNMGATAFNITGATQGTAGVVSYDGFSSADTTTVTGASGFDDTAKSNQGITFANATNVTGSGAISNVAGPFNDATLLSTTSLIDYAGFTAVAGSGTSIIGVTGSFNDSSKTSASSGVDYSGFSVNQVAGTGGNVTAVTGGFGVVTKISGASGIDYSAFNVISVSGSGAASTLTGAGQTYALANGAPNAGNSGTLAWTGFPNISDANGTINFQASGSLSGNVTAQTLNYSAYSTPVTLSLSGAAGSTTGIGGARSGVTAVTASPNSDTLTGSGATYNLTSQNAGSASGLSWTSFENITDSSGGLFNLFVASNNVTGKITSGGAGPASCSILNPALCANLDSDQVITALNVSVGGMLQLTGTATSWTLSGAPLPAGFGATNPDANVFFNGVCVGGPACGTVITITGSIGATVSQIATQALQDALDTDSVQKQIDYGFAGDVGTTPPMDHRIDETGISTPECFEQSREGEPCR